MTMTTTMTTTMISDIIEAIKCIVILPFLMVGFAAAFVAFIAIAMFIARICVDFAYWIASKKSFGESFDDCKLYIGRSIDLDTIEDPGHNKAGH